MKHRIVTISACLAIAAALAATRGVVGQEQESQPQRTQEVAVTGCVVQGTGPNVFILENAKTDPRDGDEKGRSYLLVASAMSISFREHLNHEVRIDGAAESKMPPVPPMGQKVKESDLPKLTATKITHVATTCSSSQPQF